MSQPPKEPIQFQLNKSITTERLSQSEDLRSFALRRLERFDGLEFLQQMLLACFAGHLTLQVAWLLQQFEPSYHALIRWLLFAAPIALLGTAALWGMLRFTRKVASLPPVWCLSVGLGLWLTWFIHRL